MLTLLTKPGNAKGKVRGVRDNSGLECWRQMVQDFEPKTKGRYGEMLQELLHFQFTGDILAVIR